MKTLASFNEPVQAVEEDLNPPHEFWISFPRCWTWSRPCAPPPVGCWGSPPPHSRCTRSSEAGFYAAVSDFSSLISDYRRKRSPPGQWSLFRSWHLNPKKLQCSSELYSFIVTHREILREIHWDSAFEMCFQYLQWRKYSGLFNFPPTFHESVKFYCYGMYL